MEKKNNNARVKKISTKSMKQTVGGSLVTKTPAATLPTGLVII